MRQHLKFQGPLRSAEASGIYAVLLLAFVRISEIAVVSMAAVYAPSAFKLAIKFLG